MSEEEINKMCSDIYEGEDWQPMKDYIKSLQTQLQQKDTIINEFMEELKWQRKVCLSLNESFAVSRIDTLINKLQKLKGSGNNE